jgi:predicted ATP-grasp superfamily ATP-dependent carboligase
MNLLQFLIHQHSSIVSYLQWNPELPSQNICPNFPARIYANEDINIKLAMFLSKLNLDQSMYYSISRKILQWAKQNECELIISAGTMLSEESTGSLKEQIGIHISH